MVLGPCLLQQATHIVQSGGFGHLSYPLNLTNTGNKAYRSGEVIAPTSSRPESDRGTSGTTGAEGVSGALFARNSSSRSLILVLPLEQVSIDAKRNRRVAVAHPLGQRQYVRTEVDKQGLMGVAKIVGRRFGQSSCPQSRPDHVLPQLVAIERIPIPGLE